MKKIIVVVLMMVMLLCSLTACGETHEASKTTNTATMETTYRIDGQIVSQSVYETFGGK